MSCHQTEEYNENIKEKAEDLYPNSVKAIEESQHNIKYMEYKIKELQEKIKCEKIIIELHQDTLIKAEQKLSQTQPF